MKRLSDADAGGGPASANIPEGLREKLSNAHTWIFDLDNTLYHPDEGLFDQIEARMTEFVSRRLWVDAEEARRVSEEFWEDHGATLTGLIAAEDMPAEPFLAFTHDIDVSALRKNEKLRTLILGLTGRKVVYTNGSRRHAERVTERLGLRDLFDAFYAIEDAGFAPKPTSNGFERIVAMDGMDPKSSVMVEDDLRNLQVPRDLGMATIWLRHGERDMEPPPFVDFATDELEGFLTQI